MAQTNVIDLLGPVSQICRECPVPSLTRAYIDAAREFCRRTQFLQVEITSVDTVIDQVPYTLPADSNNDYVGIKRVQIEESTDDTHDLVERAARFWDANADSDVPRFYEYVPDGVIRLHETPIGVYPLIITAVLQPKRDSLSVDSTLVAKWEEVLQLGAMYRLQRIPKMPWTDFQMSEKNERAFMASCGSASIQVSAGNNVGATAVAGEGPPAARIRTRMQPI